MTGSEAHGLRRPGLFAELLASLSVIMFGATILLAIVLVREQEARLREILGRALSAEARDPLRSATPLVPGTRWWTVGSDGVAIRRTAGAGEIDEATRALAADARSSDSILVSVGPPWEPVRFALPIDAEGHVVAARLPAGASLQRGLAPSAVALTVLIGDLAIFLVFGATLLRGRVVMPLRRLATAARAIADGARGARVPVEGAREAAEVAAAFNEMTSALERREEALTKAVADLREANRSLRVAEAGLARAERLAAVGRLAAGVAHEVGNPMGALLSFLDLAGRDPGLSGAAQSHLERARQQVERVRTILRQLLDFSRPPRAQLAPTDLTAVAEEVLALVRAQRRYDGVNFSVEREGEPPLALADASSVAQILLNLVLNAGDAVGGTGKEPGTPPRSSRVSARVRSAALVRRAADGPGEVPSRVRADAVECVVCDNGPGIAPEDRERIFDPFFTTKPPGEGTGLGLANALRLAEEQGGVLELEEPRNGSGACFVLRLPAAAASANPADHFAVRKEMRS
ncbi:MAG TPA: ATP-binding protein [Myxococcota bacterium]|nr:ATP-binding protein [Myxococcota bacterium]